MNCSTPGFPVLFYVLEFAQTHVHFINDAIQPPHSLSPPSPPALSPFQHQGLFQRVGLEKTLYQLQHQSFQWIFRQISFMRDWLDLLAVQRTLKSLLQHDNSKASILRCSAFFIDQLSQQFSSVEFSRSVVSDCLQPHELQHTRLPCPSPTPRIYPNSCPSSWWCHPTISSSVVPFSSCLRSLEYK